MWYILSDKIWRSQSLYGGVLKANIFIYHVLDIIWINYFKKNTLYYAFHTRQHRFVFRKTADYIKVTIESNTLLSHSEEFLLFLYDSLFVLLFRPEGDR